MLVDSLCLFESVSTMPHMGIALSQPALLFGNGFNGAAVLNVLQQTPNQSPLPPPSPSPPLSSDLSPSDADSS